MQHVEFRLPVRQRLYWLVVAGLWLPVAALRLAAGGLLSGILALVVAATLTAAFFVSARYGVTLTPHDLIVRGIRRKVIARHAIRDVTAAGFVSSRRVALHLADGSVARPWTPLHNWAQPDAEFDRKFQTIYDWWFSAPGTFAYPPPFIVQTAGSLPPPIPPAPRRSTTR